MDMESDPPFNAPLNADRPDALIDVDQSLTYWNSVSSDNNGMLGGFPQVSRIDLQGSNNFLAKLRRGRSRASKQSLPPLGRVADCGAGIGRITKGLLLPLAQRVDIVEPVKKFTDELVQSLGNGQFAGDGEAVAGDGEAVAGDGEAVHGKGQVGHVINLRLQNWEPESGAYDLIWNQWCVGHLTDAELVVYLQRCTAGLNKAKEGDEANDAWIVVKENLSTDIRHKDIYDEEDSSVTRSDINFRRLFQEARLKIVATELQKGMPRDLYPVRIYALRPE